MLSKGTLILVATGLACVLLTLVRETRGIPVVLPITDENTNRPEQSTTALAIDVDTRAESKNRVKGQGRNARFLWWGSGSEPWSSSWRYPWRGGADFGGLQGSGGWGHWGWGNNYGGGISRPWANSWTWPGNRNSWWGGSSWWPSSWWSGQSYWG